MPVRLDPITLNQALAFALCPAITPQFTSFRLVRPTASAGGGVQVTSGTHSALAPHLPIPNRTVKRGCADDSVHSYAKVGQCQTPHAGKSLSQTAGAFVFLHPGRSWRRMQARLTPMLTQEAIQSFHCPLHVRRMQMHALSAPRAAHNKILALVAV